VPTAIAVEKTALDKTKKSLPVSAGRLFSF
jgi:hypothetical protein